MDGRHDDADKRGGGASMHDIAGGRNQEVDGRRRETLLFLGPPSPMLLHFRFYHHPVMISSSRATCVSSAIAGKSAESSSAWRGWQRLPEIKADSAAADAGDREDGKDPGRSGL